MAAGKAAHRISGSAALPGLAAMLLLAGLAAAGCTSKTAAIDAVPTGSVAAAPAPAAFGDDAREYSMLGTVPVAFTNRKWLFKWWRAREPRAAAYLQGYCAGEDVCADPRLARLRGAVTKARSMDPERRIAAANAAVNGILAYREEDPSAADSDRWQSFMETLERGAGDCEDYAIMKYHVLRAMGVRPEAMTLLVLKDATTGAYHAVLAVSIDGRNLILDSLTDRILVDDTAGDYRVLFSFNGEDMRIHGTRTAAG
ncbi:transglutaminase-like cysteine peptidase [Oricola thermophila]|uniref:Transglutaminase-like cysteine peptidase n=1 Tax=Oricola thermophila TaxID=2742145 RepID=A0A6N1VGY5_9HYPH|nr:transglutaminase-like cysteine peptidase [Oricola thermophila]QKV20186.1 transglutaminase-like cysteine peptidase [Oricola thermophila]